MTDDEVMCAEHVRHDSFATAATEYGRLVRTYGDNPEHPFQIFQCVLSRSRGRHWHVGRVGAKHDQLRIDTLRMKGKLYR